MTEENFDESLEEGDQIRIVEDKEPEDPFIRFVGAGIQLDFQDRDLLQGFLEWMAVMNVRVEVGNSNFLFYWKELDDASND